MMFSVLVRPQKMFLRTVFHDEMKWSGGCTVKMHGICREMNFSAMVKKACCVLSTLACFTASTFVCKGTSKVSCKLYQNYILGSLVQSGTS